MLSRLYFGFLLALISFSLQSQCESSIELISVTPVGTEYEIEVQANIGGGILGADTGASGPTRDFLFAFRTPGNVPITISSFTSSVVGEETGNTATGADIGALPNPPWSSEGNIFYTLNSTNELECIISTASCGEPNTSVYDFSFTVDVIPEEIEVLGLEGDGNPFGGCTVLNGDDVIINAGLLPVEWLDFVGELQGSKVWLKWETAEEENNFGFHIERLNQNREWTLLGFVPGKGNFVGRTSYEFVDERPLPGNNIYRIRQEDYDGSVSYSSLLQIEATGKDIAVDIYPNPFKEWLVVNLPVEEKAVLILRNIHGQPLLKKSIVATERIDMVDLPSGLYSLEISQGSTVWVERIIK